MQSFDDADLRTAMRTYLATADRLAVASVEGESARDLVDLAEAKAMAGMVLRKRLLDLGWSSPVSQRVST